MDIIIFILGTYLVYKIFTLFVEIKIVKVDELPDEFVDAEKENLIVCRTETHNNIIYVWEKETDTFLTQGNSMEDVVHFFVKNYPNTKILFEREKSGK